MFKKIFKKKSQLKPKSPKEALHRFKTYNKDGTLQSVLPSRVTDTYGHTFGPKTGSKRSSVTRSPLRSVEIVKVQAPEVKDERKPKIRSSIPMGSGRHGLFRMFRKK